MEGLCVRPCTVTEGGWGGEKLFTLRVSSGVPGLKGPLISKEISEGGTSPSSEGWIMARRVGMTTSDLVGVLGLEGWRRNGNRDGDEDEDREWLREDTPVNCL